MKRVQLEIVLGTVFALMSVGILTVMAFDEKNRLAEFEQSQRAELIEFGAAVYEINCTSCHGSHAQGVDFVAPCLRCEELFTTRLEDIGWDGGLEDYIISVVTTGRQISTRPAEFVGGGSPAMPTWSEKLGGPLRDDQINAVAAFIMNFEEWALNPDAIPTPIEEVAAVDDPVARGFTLYNQFGCGACHTISRLSAGIVGPALNGIATRAATRVDGLSAEDYLYESIVLPSEYVVEDFLDNLMPPNFVDLLSEDQLQDLIAFLMTFEEE
ncbi:MAG: c-type cytochrome [Chloroflexi bacterium]|nr:c-type cytochrome [Chloroflexota bacterium]